MDLEDGELSGSDSEMGKKGRALPQLPSHFSGHSFQHRVAVQDSAASYRSSEKAVESSDQESSDEESSVWRKKRQKVSSDPQPPTRFTLHQPTLVSNSFSSIGRKVNNIWGSVVQEQCQDAVTAELGFFGMEGEIDTSTRNVETYNYVLAKKIREKERVQEQQSKEGAGFEMLDDQLEEYMKGQGSEGSGIETKGKRHVKDRLGDQVEMDIKGRFEITEDDPDDKVVDEITHRLQEPKKDLIERVVKVVGKKTAIDLLQETAKVEEDGGLYTMDGSRRRTPGGVYLNLLKKAPSVSKTQIKKIFIEESLMEQKNKKAAQKRKRHVLAKKMKQAIGTLNLQEHDDVSRETFASDTNEALESLEEAAEEETQGEVPAGTEETPVVYSSADLEVF